MTLPLIVGLGSHSADDRAGWMVLDRLKALGIDDDCMRRLLVPVDLLDFAVCDRQLVICDACQGAGPVGAIHCWTWPTETILPSPSRGTHDVGLTDVLELGRNFGSLPDNVEIWGIEGQSWQPDMPTSDSVLAATNAVATAIWSKYTHA